jgi:hypothetical protein
MPAFVNLTPHPITLLLPSGREKEFAPSGTVARVDDTPSDVDTIAVEGEEVDVLFTEFGDEISGLPEPRENTYYLVSPILAMACPERSDLLAPATGPNDDPVRDEEGRIAAVRSFRRYG